MRKILTLIIISFNIVTHAQEVIELTIKSESKAIEWVNLFNSSEKLIGTSDSLGKVIIYRNQIKDSIIKFKHPDLFNHKTKLKPNQSFIYLKSKHADLDEIVISGNLKEVKKYNCVTPIENFNINFLNRIPSCNIFESVQNVNGVRPQINCAVCNTGDIHINGLEGPYTMVLIDGMPIVSNLSTVYGLSGIPNSLIERVEVVKGPASSLYGSEAIGGIINIITKKTEKAPKLTIDYLGTNQLEQNLDLGFKSLLFEKNQVLTGINYYNFSNLIDLNQDNFTDFSLSERISIFQKWKIPLKSQDLNIAGRYFYEDRWGGELDWNKIHRGTDQKYGESIYTSRLELIGNYKLPFSENMNISFSYNKHNQNSYYGTTSFKANQAILFNQITYNKTIKNNELLLGVNHKNINYDDNTPATENFEEIQNLIGFFLQDEIQIKTKYKLLIGSRLDYSNIHNLVYTPRLGLKVDLKNGHVLRLNSGTGYRNVNVFTEDHAALSGARIVVLEKNLKPEQSYNVNVNYYKNFYFKKGQKLQIDFSLFYTHFTNRILPDYTQLDKIVYANISGKHINKGTALNIIYQMNDNLKINIGTTLIDNKTYENNSIFTPFLTEKFNANWGIEYSFKKTNTNIAYTGFLVGPMLLPLVNELDPRPSSSPTWSNQNIVINQKIFNDLNCFLGVKNILNYTPDKSTNFLISRAHDPFDKTVQYDQNGGVIATKDNPYALTFDPSYIFAPNQGIRVIFGFKYNIN